MTEITNKIYYVGVNDRNKHRFEGLWPLPNGVSYNSYIIDDEKVALVDTVEVDFFTQFLENIHEVIGDREIDYLIINDIRVVTHTIRQRPETLKTMLVAVVNTYVINLVYNFCHIFSLFYNVL